NALARSRKACSRRDRSLFGGCRRGPVPNAGIACHNPRRWYWRYGTLPRRQAALASARLLQPAPGNLRMSNLSSTAGRMPAQGTAYAIILAVSFCHMLNDIMQSLLAAIYPLLKEEFSLDYWQIGLLTLAFMVT